MPVIPTNQLRSMITAEAQAQDVDPRFALAIAFGGEKTTGDPLAVSPKKAAGIFQLLPSTATEVGVTDVFDPVQNIRGGIKYIKKLWQMFGGDLEKTAAAYNAGPGAVQRYGGIPPYAETQAYVPNTLAAYRKEYVSSPGNDPFYPTGQAQLGYREAVAQSIGARDPRQPIIDLGLRIMGRTRESFGDRWNDPQFVDNFYRATKGKAEAENSQLNATSALSNYESVLTKMAQTAEAERKKPEAQSSVAPAPPKGKSILPSDMGETLDVIAQTARGVVVDPVVGVLETASDLFDLANKTLTGSGVIPDALPLGDLTYGQLPTSAANAPRPGETLKGFVDRVLGEPQTHTAGLTRSLAGFLAPFFGITNKLRTAVGLGTTTAGVASGAITNAAFVDPDSPLIVDMIDQFARGIAPNDPNSIKSAVTRYITGELNPTEFQQRMAARGIRAGESMLMDGVFMAFKLLRGSKQTKTAVVQEAESTPVNPSAKGNAESTPGQLPPKPISESGGPAKFESNPLTGEKIAVPEATGQTISNPLTGEINRVGEGVAPKVQPKPDMKAKVPEAVPPGYQGKPNVGSAGEEINPLTGAGTGSTKIPPPTSGSGELANPLTGEVVTAAQMAKATSLIEKTKVVLTDPVNQKIALAVALKGTVGGLISNELIDPFEASAATDSADKNTKSLANFLIGAGIAVAGGTAGAIKLARKLRASVDEGVGTLGTSLNLHPPTRMAGPGFAFIKTSEKDVMVPTSLEIGKGQHVRIALEAVRDPEDLAQLHAQAIKLFPESEVARKTLLGTHIDDIPTVASKTGADPRTLELLKASTTPYQYSAQAKTLITLATASQKNLRHLAGEIKAGNLSVGDEFLRQIAIGGEIARGLQVGSSDFGRALNVFRQASDGLIDFTAMEGAMAGSKLKTGYDLEKLATRFLGLSDEGISHAARTMTDPTLGGAMAEAVLSSWLMLPAGAAKQAISDVGRIVLELFVREFGALEGRAWQLLGYEVPKGTPYLDEPLIMVGSLASNAVNAIKAAWTTAKTGVNVFSEHGMRYGTNIGNPQFTKEAFRPITGALGLDTNPAVGNFIDSMGGAIRTAGSRLRLSADELTQYLIYHMELDAMATRAARDAGKSGDDLAKFLHDFKLNPPEEVAKEIRHQKETLTFMNPLFDERGGFQKAREIVGKLNAASTESALARVQLPFMKAHMNLLTAAAEFTPGINLTSAAFRKELTSSDPIIRAGAQGRLWTGLGLATFAAYLGAQGIITGPLSTDKALQDELTRAGRKPNSLHIGDHAIALAEDEPIGFLLRLFGGIGAHAGGEVTPEEMSAAQSGLIVATELITHAPVLETFGRIFDALDRRKLEMESDKKGTGETVGSTVDQLFFSTVLPPLVAQRIAAVIEPHKQIADSYLQKVANRTPFANSGVTETDIFGRPRFVGGGVNGGMVNNAVRLFFPADINPQVTDPLDKALAAKGVVIHDPRPVFSMGPIDVPLEKSEVQQIKNFMANPPMGLPPLYKALSDLVALPDFKDASPGKDGLATILVHQVVNRYATAARRMLFADNPQIRQRVNEKAQTNGFKVDLNLVP